MAGDRHGGIRRVTAQMRPTVLGFKLLTKHRSIYAELEVGVAGDVHRVTMDAGRLEALVDAYLASRRGAQEGAGLVTAESAIRSVAEANSKSGDDLRVLRKTILLAALIARNPTSEIPVALLELDGILELMDDQPDLDSR